jgi:hypothetical protein
MLSPITPPPITWLVLVAAGYGEFGGIGEADYVCEVGVISAR